MWTQFGFHENFVHIGADFLNYRVPNSIDEKCQFLWNFHFKCLLNSKIIACRKNITHSNCQFIHDNSIRLSIFSCGQFVDNTIIPDDKVFVNTFTAVDDKLREDLRIIITSPIEEKEIEPFKMVKKLYLACMNESETMMNYINYR